MEPWASLGIPLGGLMVGAGITWASALQGLKPVLSWRIAPFRPVPPSRCRRIETPKTGVASTKTSS
jgi:hypothetical protein